MFSLASSKLRRHKKKNKQSHNNERTTTNNHQPEFQLKVRRGNESEIQEVPLWIPLSIMAESAAISCGASIHNAQIASSVIIGHGNVVANRYHHAQRGSLSRKADAFGEITVAAKISALSLLRSGESIQSSKAVEDAVLGWGGFLIAYVYANKLITLDGIAEEGSSTPGGNDEHNPLWQASLDAVSRNDDYSNMTIPSGQSQPQNTTSKNKPIVDYYKTNIGNIPIIGNDIYLVSQKGVQKGESKIIPLQQEEQEDVSAGGRVSLTDRISSALFNDGQLVKDVLSWEDKNEDVSSTNKNRNGMIDIASTDSSNGDDGQEQYINDGILSPPTTSVNNDNYNKPTRKIGSKHLSKKEMLGISAMALLLILCRPLLL